MEVSLDPGDIVLAGINQSSFITGMTERTPANTQPGSPKGAQPPIFIKDHATYLCCCLTV